MRSRRFIATRRLPIRCHSESGKGVRRSSPLPPPGSLDGCITIAHHPASHYDEGDDYEKVSRYYVSQLAYLATRLNEMPEGEGTVLDNSCLMFVNNMWSGSKHDSSKVPLLLAGGLGGSLETGRVLDFTNSGDDNRKLCSLYLSLMDRMDVKLPQFGDSDVRLAGL